MNLTITISESQKKTLRPLAEPIKTALSKMETHHKKYAELAKKDRLAEKEVAKYQRAAAGFDRTSELQLIACLKQRERLAEALAKSEEQAADDKLPLWRAIDAAFSALQQTLQGAYQQLLDYVVSEAGKFFDNRDSLRFEARNWPVATAFVREMLMLNVVQNDSSERLVSVANELLRRMEALTDAKLEWTYQGLSDAAPGEKPKAA
jgi:hypothetical protein